MGKSYQSKWGIDICGFAIVDVFRKTAFHLNAIQTPHFENMTPVKLLLADSQRKPFVFQRRIFLSGCRCIFSKN